MSCGHLSVKRDQATAEASPSPSSPASTALQTTSTAAETALQTTSTAVETALQTTSAAAETALQTTSAAAETALQTTSAATETSSRSPQEMSIVARTQSGGKKKRRSLVGSNATKPAGVYDERLDSIEKANKDVWSVDVWDKDSDDDVEARKRLQTSEFNLACYLSYRDVFKCRLWLYSASDFSIA